MRATTGKKWIVVGTVFGFLAVFAGAFGAHGLADTGFLERAFEGESKSIVGFEVPAAWKYLGDFRTGVRYHMFHAVALLLLGIAAPRCSRRCTEAAGWLFCAGTVLFSGSLYTLVIAGPDWLGIPWGLTAATGGTLQLFGWISFCCAAVRGAPETQAA